MVMQAVCDAWIGELTTNVAPVTVGATTFTMTTATIHRYASWSSAAVADSALGLHLAVWPEGDPEVRRGLTTDGSDEITTRYQAQAWCSAVAENTRVFDDNDANAAWLALYEAVKARFYLRANLAIGDPGSVTHYKGGRLTQIGDKRVLVVAFEKVRYQTLA